MADNDDTQVEVLLGGFFAGVIVTLIVAFAFWLGTDCIPRQGYAYVNPARGGRFTVNMDSLNGSKTELTDSVSFDEASKICNAINKSIDGHTNK